VSKADMLHEEQKKALRSKTKVRWLNKKHVDVLTEDLNVST